MTTSMSERMGWLRAGVGIALIAAPGPPLRLSRRHHDGAARLLMRTIGIRDLVLGLGTVAAARSTPGDARRWITMTLASDTLDVVASVVSVRSIGKRDALLAAALALVFVVKDVAVLRDVLGPTDDLTIEPDHTLATV